MREIRVFHKEDGHVGVLVTQNAVELFSAGLNLVRHSVGNVIQHKYGGVLDAGHKFCNLQIQEGVAAEAQIDDGAVKAAGQDIGVGHTRTGGTATLQDAGTVHNDGTVGVGAVQDGLLNGVAFRNAQFQGLDFVVQGQVEHILALHRLHVGHQLALALRFAGLPPLETGTYRFPLPVQIGVEVQAARTAVCHVGHVIARVGPLGVDLRGVGAEPDVETGGVGAQIPKLIPDYPVHTFGEAAVAGAVGL